MRINKCHICENDFDNLEAHFIASHIIETNTEENPSENDSTNEHQKSPWGNQCDTCSSSFGDVGQLRRHIRRVHEENKFSLIWILW